MGWGGGGGGVGGYQMVRTKEKREVAGGVDNNHINVNALFVLSVLDPAKTRLKD